jgi:hypothetical protein
MPRSVCRGSERHFHLSGRRVMNPVSSLSQSSYTALKGHERAVALVESSAIAVASHPAELTYGPQFEAFIQLQNARVQASSNIAVLRTINLLYHELSRLPRL